MDYKDVIINGYILSSFLAELLEGLIGNIDIQIC